MKILHLDTATTVFSVALTGGEQIIAEFCGDAGPATSATIPGQIQALLTSAGLDIAEIDALAVTVGPGSFTGVRVGIALVKGLAYSTCKPVIPLSSLELLAHNAKSSAIPVCAMFDARRGEVYTATYSFSDGVKLIRPEIAIDPAELLDQVEGDLLFIGDGAVRYRDLIEERLGKRAFFADARLNQPIASAGTLLALNRFKSNQTVSSFELAPSYLRLSEAELKKCCSNS